MARVGLALSAALALIPLCLPPTANASPPPPDNLTVVGGEDAWHADNRFELEWTNPPGATPLGAVHYRIRDPLGVAIGETKLGWVTEGIAALTVPDVPGIYTAEVWLEDAAGAQGSPAVARLRFDDSRPGTIEPLPVPSWVGRTAFPLTVRLGHPQGPAPLSGIRGYAVAIDSAIDGGPCATVDRCLDKETSLRGGIDDDSLTIAALPEGTSFLHAVAVSGSGMKSAVNGQAVLRIDTTDPITRLEGTADGWVDHPVKLTAAATDTGSGMEPDGQGPPPFTAIRVDDGAPTIRAGGSSAETVIGEGAHRIAYYARDAAGNVDDGGASNNIPNPPPRTTLVRIDRKPPSVAFANSQDPHDPELVRVRIADPLSGPDSSRGRIGVRAAGSGDPFTPLPLLPAGDGELHARWDSDAYPAGEYEFRAVGYDAAGNATATTRRADGSAMVLSNPLKTMTTLRAGFGGRALRTAPYGRGVRLDGRLDASGGTPLAGMPVRVVERFAAGAEPSTQTSIVTTDSGGGFSVHLAPGPSREVTASFGGSPTLTRSSSRSLGLGVRSAVRLRTSSAVARIGGTPLVFRGRIAGVPGAIPSGGKSVQLQFRLPGLPWAEFRTIQTDRRGRFRYAYRFSDDDSRGARFQFRAYAPAQSGWPYEPGGSLPVAVRGL